MLESIEQRERMIERQQDDPSDKHCEDDANSLDAAQEAAQENPFGHIAAAKEDNESTPRWYRLNIEDSEVQRVEEIKHNNLIFKSESASNG